jgi:hypothetical protein
VAGWRGVATVLLAGGLTSALALAAGPAPQPQQRPAGTVATPQTRPAPQSGPGAERVEKFPDGAVHVRYHVDAQGRKDGPYEEFHPNGKPAVKGAYAADVKTGPWTTYTPEGKLTESASYFNGLMEGPYAWNAPAGKASVRGTARQGGFAGPVTVVDETGKVNLHPEYPRTLGEIRKTWVSLYPREVVEELNGTTFRKIAPTKFTQEPNLDPPYRAGEVAAESMQEALKALKLYRYLAGLPWTHLAIDPSASKKAQPAAVLINKLKRCTHTPSKPADMDDAFFKVAETGCHESNLSEGESQLPGTVRDFMDDSGPTNRAAIGHRLWMLKPQLKRVGFGFVPGWGALHVQDGAWEPVSPQFKSFGFPSAGYYPRGLVEPNYVWNVSISPSAAVLPPSATPTVKVTRLDEHFQPVEEVKTDSIAVVREPLQMKGWSVVVFQPKLTGERAGVSLTRSRAAVPAGKYAVEIGNLVTAKGAPTHFGYVVDLVDFPEAQPAEVRTGGEPPIHSGPPTGPVIHSTTTKAAN